jgi:hypothetical protein
MSVILGIAVSFPSLIKHPADYLKWTVSLRDVSTEVSIRTEWIELLFLFVFQFALFFWIQLGFFAVFTTAFILLVITTHTGFSSSNNPFGVNRERTPAVTIDLFSIVFGAKLRNKVEKLA